MRHRTPTAVLLGAVLSLGVVACGDDAAEAATCDAAQQFADSLRSLGSLDLSAEGTDGLDAALDDVESAWTDLEDEAGDQFGGAVDQLDAALGDAVDTVSSLGGASSLDEAATAAADAITNVEAAWNSLQADLEAEFSDCDLPAG